MISNILQILGLQPRIFKSFSRSLEQFFLTLGQNNFGKKIPFLFSFIIFFCTYQELWLFFLRHQWAHRNYWDLQDGWKDRRQFSILNFHDHRLVLQHRKIPLLCRPGQKWIFTFCLTSCLGLEKQDFWPNVNILKEKPLYFVSSTADSSSKSAKILFLKVNFQSKESSKFFWSFFPIKDNRLDFFL